MQTELTVEAVERLREQVPAIRGLDEIEQRFEGRLFFGIQAGIVVEERLDARFHVERGGRRELDEPLNTERLVRVDRGTGGLRKTCQRLRSVVYRGESQQFTADRRLKRGQASALIEDLKFRTVAAGRASKCLIAICIR